MDGELRAQGLRKRYGPKEVVRGVDLALRRGEIVALFGPNGAGKTTTFYMVVGFIRPTGGRIYLKGQEITALPMYKRARLGLGYLPQEPSAFRRMTALENLLAVLEFQPLSKKERLEKAKALLEELSIYHLRDRMAYSLSGGERRRLEIARALATDPDFLLLDEPSLGLAPLLVREIFDIVARVNAEEGVTVLVVEQNARVALSIAHYGYIMESGRIVLEGDRAYLLENPDVQEFYLGVAKEGGRKSFKEVKAYKRRKRFM